MVDGPCEYTAVVSVDTGTVGLHLVDPLDAVQRPAAAQFAAACEALAALNRYRAYGGADLEAAVASRDRCIQGVIGLRDDARRRALGLDDARVAA